MKKILLAIISLSLLSSCNLTDNTIDSISNSNPVSESTLLDPTDVVSESEKASVEVSSDSENDTSSGLDGEIDDINQERVELLIEQINNLPSNEDILNNYILYKVDVGNAMNRYESLNESEKKLVTNSDRLFEAVKVCNEAGFYYFLNSAFEEGISDSQFKNKTKGAVDAYNETLTVEQKHAISDEDYDKLLEIVEKYNSYYPNNPKRQLVLEEKDAE